MGRALGWGLRRALLLGTALALALARNEPLLLLLGHGGAAEAGSGKQIAARATVARRAIVGILRAGQGWAWSSPRADTRAWLAGAPYRPRWLIRQPEQDQNRVPKPKRKTCVSS
ncbi:hypothetical protein ACFQU7_04470 [Pseudoroseomonas wenyumeiae]